MPNFNFSRGERVPDDTTQEGRWDEEARRKFLESSSPHLSLQHTPRLPQVGIPRTFHHRLSIERDRECVCGREWKLLRHVSNK